MIRNIDESGKFYWLLTDKDNTARGVGKGGLVAAASSAIPETVGCLVGKEKCYSNLEFMEDIIPGKN